MWIQKVPGGGVESLCFAADGRTVYTADAKWWVTAWPVGGAKGRRLFRPRYGLRGLFLMRCRLPRPGVFEQLQVVAGIVQRAKPRRPEEDNRVLDALTAEARHGLLVLRQ